MVQETPFSPTPPLPTIPVFTQQTDTAAAVSPVTHTYALPDANNDGNPDNGVYEIIVQAYVNNDLNVLAMYTDRVVYFKGSKNLQVHGAAGPATAYATPNSIGLSMAVANVTAAGNVVVTLAWTDGGTYASRCIIRARKLHDIVSTL